MINSTNLIINKDGSIFHLGIKPGELASSVILVGDPGRVKLIASFFDTILFERSNREFVMATGLYRDMQISVLATGIGTDNIDIVVNELDTLVNVDFENRAFESTPKKLNLIRLGTCGSFQKHVEPGDLVISKKAYGQDSLMLYYPEFLDMALKDNEELLSAKNYFLSNDLGPIQYIAHSSPKLFEYFKELGHTGITLTASGFYGPQGRQLRTKSLPGWDKEFIANYQDSNGNSIYNLEMECSALYGLGGLLGHECITICLAIAQRSSKNVLSNYKERMKEVIPDVLNCLLQNT